MSKGLNYALVNKDLAIILGRGTCTDKHIVIPDEIEEHIVYAIDAYAFANDDALESVIIANTVTRIGRDAFKNCKKLKTVTASENTYLISRGIFSSCSNLENITLGSLKQLKTWMDKECFYNSNNIIKIEIKKG